MKATQASHLGEQAWSKDCSRLRVAAGCDPWNTSATNAHQCEGPASAPAELVFVPLAIWHTDLSYG